MVWANGKDAPRQKRWCIGGARGADMIVRTEIPWCGRKQSEQMRKRVPYIGRHVVNPYQYFNVGISTNTEMFCEH